MALRSHGRPRHLLEERTVFLSKAPRWSTAGPLGAFQGPGFDFLTATCRDSDRQTCHLYQQACRSRSNKRFWPSFCHSGHWRIKVREEATLPRHFYPPTPGLCSLERVPRPADELPKDSEGAICSAVPRQLSSLDQL